MVVGGAVVGGNVVATVVVVVVVVSTVAAPSSPPHADSTSAATAVSATTSRPARVAADLGELTYSACDCTGAFPSVPFGGHGTLATVPTGTAMRIRRNHHHTVAGRGAATIVAIALFAGLAACGSDAEKASRTTTTTSPTTTTTAAPTTVPPTTVPPTTAAPTTLAPPPPERPKRVGDLAVQFVKGLVAGKVIDSFANAEGRAAARQLLDDDTTLDDLARAHGTNLEYLVDDCEVQGDISGMCIVDVFQKGNRDDPLGVSVFVDYASFDVEQGFDICTSEENAGSVCTDDGRLADLDTVRPVVTGVYTLEPQTMEP